MENYYLGLGILMLLALGGVYLVNRYGQSAILAYIVVGIVIGPSLAEVLSIPGYHGVISDHMMIEQLLEVGLIFLFFFVGLEFSITRLKETKKAAAAIAITHVAANLFVGFAIATIFGWDLFGSIFLAGVIAVSSAAVATKTLKDLGRLSGREVKFLLTSIIVEDFILIIMIALTSGSAMRGGDLDAWAVVRLIASVCFLYSIFLLLGFIIIPRLYHHLEKMQSDELFVLFAMAVIFLAAALGDMLQIPRPLGAFFMGMTFAETRFSQKLTTKLNSIRMGFTAIFFMTFGMMISFELTVLTTVFMMLAITVPWILFNQILIHGSISFLIGFTPREAVTIGSCLGGRGEDTLLYASVGANLKNAGMEGLSTAEAYVFQPRVRDTLFSFAGIYCFIMATLAPVIVKNIAPIVKKLKAAVPKKWVFGAHIVQRTMRPTMFSHGGAFTREEKRLLAGFSAYAAMLFGVILMRDMLLFIVFAVGGVAVIYYLRGAIDAYLSPNIDIGMYDDMHLLIKDGRGIKTFIIDSILKIVSAPFLGATIWGFAQIIANFTGYYIWWIAPVGALMMIGSIAMGCERIYDVTMVRPKNLRKEHMIKGYSKGWEKLPKKKGDQPPKKRYLKDRSKPSFRPVKYDELISSKGYNDRFNELSKMKKRRGKGGKAGRGIKRRK